MKTVIVYEAWIGDELKFASISEEERAQFCEMWIDNGGAIPDIQAYEREAVDHSKK